MSVLTASAVKRESLGSLTLIAVEFTSVNGGSSTGDTYASGLGTNVVAYWCNCGTLPATQVQQGVNVTNTSGTFTISPAVNSSAVTLFILARC